jgi:hypothetical protein
MAASGDIITCMSDEFEIMLIVWEIILRCII